MFATLALAGVLVIAVCIVAMSYLILTGNPNEVVCEATTLAVLEPTDDDQPSDHPVMHSFNAELHAWLDGELEAYHDALDASRPLHIDYRPQDPRQ